ncbi:nucleotidyltransferase domain-containing protein [Persephonella sp.]
MIETKQYSKEDYMNLIASAIENVMEDRCLIIFFGSILTDRFSRVSDIDVAVYCKDDISSKEYLEILENIENLPILKEVDIIDIKKTNNIQLIENILKGKVWKNIPELMKDLKRHTENLKK